MKITLEQLKDSAEFKLLTPSEQSFVKRFISNGGDPTDATAHAFDTKTEASSRAFGRSVLGRAAVRQVLGLYHGQEDPTKQDLLDQLWAIVESQKSSAVAKVQAAKMYAELKGWKKEDKPASDLDKALEGLI